MQILLLVVTIIGVFIVALLIAAALMKKEYAIARSVVIDKPNDEVFNYIKFLKNQDYYSKWVMMDPQMKKIFKGTDGTVGFIYGWNGNKKAGEGEQEITRIVDRQRMDTEVRFVRPFKAVATAQLITSPVSANQTNVIWTTGGKTPYPMNIMNGLYNSMLGKDMEYSLGLLKGILEKNVTAKTEGKYAGIQV